MAPDLRLCYARAIRDAPTLARLLPTNLRGTTMLASTANRVMRRTTERANELIRRQTEQSIAWHAAAGPEAIERRLAELDAEWDIERCLETLAPTFSLFGLTFGITFNRKWLIVPLLVQAFFLQHALQGWCPPIPVLRYLGVRTATEIAEERYALKALRGDFKRVEGTGSPIGAAIEAARPTGKSEA
jgi:hypothetical protein